MCDCPTLRRWMGGAMGGVLCGVELPRENGEVGLTFWHICLGNVAAEVVVDLGAKLQQVALDPGELADLRIVLSVHLVGHEGVGRLHGRLCLIEEPPELAVILVIAVFTFHVFPYSRNGSAGCGWHSTSTGTSKARANFSMVSLRAVGIFRFSSERMPGAVRPERSASSASDRSCIARSRRSCHGL